MEEKKGKDESHSQHPQPTSNSPSNSHSSYKIKLNKKLNKKRIIIFVIILAIIAIIVLSYFGILKLPETGSEILNIDYKIYESETNVLIEQAETKFTAGFVSSGLGFQSSKIDEEIKGMNVRGEKTINLEPADAYGEYNNFLVNEINRTEKTERKAELNRTIEVTVERFKEIFNEEPILNKEYELPGVVWKYKVNYVDDENVTVQAQAKIGDELPSGITGIKRVVTKITSEIITTMLEGERQEIPISSGTLEIYLDNVYLYFKMNPYTDKQITIGEYTGYVTEITEEKIIIDGNHPYAGKTITIEIKIISKEKGSSLVKKQKIPGAPTMQVFIMSYCPYGIQMLKGLLPMWKEFDDVANIELRFVGYTMHGQKEEQENYRIICIREEQYSKLIPYLECFSLSDDSLGCMQQAGVDKPKVEECMENRAPGYYEEDKELCDEYGVQGSPTTIIEGQEASIYPRSPQDIANALCDVFISKPSECSLTFSTANPSPGFGGGTSNQGGQC